MKQYDFVRLAKAARREQKMREIVYGKKVTAGTMEVEGATQMTQDMREIAEVLEYLVEWKKNKQPVTQS